MRQLLRPAAVLVAVLLTTTVLVGPAEAAADDRAGGWLERQLTDGRVHNDQFDFDDLGLTADFAFALRAIGGQPQAVRDIRNALADDVNAWTRFGGKVSAGSTAKAIVLAQVTGADERSFGGVNLVRRLQQQVRDNGRIRDQGPDFANTIGQAFAARGLANADSRRAGKATGYLLKQQCSRGYFRLNFTPAGQKRQTCDSGDATTSAPDTDVTALAVLSLRAIRGKKSPAVRAAIADGVDWLKRRQKDNGSFGGGPSTRGSNTNSTGLAAWALGESGACRPAVRAARWIRDLQVPGGVGGTPLAGESGTVAYNQAAYNAGERNGIDETERDQWRRATAQAGPGLTFLAVKQCAKR